MAKERVQYVCSECGSTQMKWLGKCPDCGEWNTLQEVRAPKPASRTARERQVAGSETTAVALPDIPESLGTRITLQNRELNRVLGGGIVPGSAVLVGGDPGIGKSTLLLQMAAEVAQTGNVLYVSAEESVHQIGRRAARLGIEASHLYVLADIIVEDILDPYAKTPHPAFAQPFA